MRSGQLEGASPLSPSSKPNVGEICETETSVICCP